MTITVAQLLAKVAIDLQESSSFSSGLWTADEMLGYVNYAEVDFLRRTGILMTDDIIYVGGLSTVTDNEFFGWAEYIATGAPSTGGSSSTVIIFNKPTDSMDVERISYNTKMLYRSNSWNLNRENPSWRVQAPGNPRYFHEDNIGVGMFEVDRMPSAGAGSFRIFSSLMPTPHSSTSEALTVPDAWEQYIRWLVISLALEKDGDGQDLARSRYAQQRYMMGVALAVRLVRGSLDDPIEAVTNGR